LLDRGEDLRSLLSLGASSSNQLRASSFFGSSRVGVGDLHAVCCAAATV